MIFRSLAHNSWLLSWTLLIFLGASLETMLYLNQQRLDQEWRTETVAFAGQMRARVDRELNAVLYLTSELGSYLTVHHDSLDPRELENMLATIYAGSRHIRNFGIAVGYRLSYVYPLAGNEKAIGLDYRTHPEQWPAVRQAIASRKAVLAEGVRLVQGGMGIIYRVPIFIDGQYWGLLSTVIDAGSFMKAAFLDVASDGYRFALRGSAIDGAPGKVLWGPRELFDDPAVIQVTSDNGWSFAVKALGPHSQTLLLWLIRGLGWAFILTMTLAIRMALRHRESLGQLALTDSLTDLPNRRLLGDRIEQALAHCKRHPETAYTLIFFDLDGFKAINDEHGHKAGDAVLQIVAARVRRCLREGDAVGRWGGDEFVVLAEELDDGPLEQWVQRLRQRIEMPVNHEGRHFLIGASIGWAVCPRDARTAQDLIRLADHRMYEDKRRRKSPAA